MNDERLHALAERMRGAERLTILTGAGVSAASGVPTFRGSRALSGVTPTAHDAEANGERTEPMPLWEQFRPEDLATPEAFARDPHLVWKWYAWRRDKVAACEPNPAHHVIAQWSQRDTCRVITQNVDDLHLRARTRQLVRLHGSLWDLACWHGCARGRTPWHDDRVPLHPIPPQCPHCGGLARPAVVWFGEMLAPGDVEAAIDACDCDLFMTVGTSAVVHPAAGLVARARHQGAFTVEINLEVTPASSIVDLAIHGPAEQILPRLDELRRRAEPERP